MSPANKAGIVSIDGIVIPPKPPLPLPAAASPESEASLPDGRLDDIAVPPKPPLPVPVSVSVTVQTSAPAEVDVEAEGEVDVEVESETATEVAVEADPASETAVEADPASETTVAAEPASETTVEAEPAAAAASLVPAVHLRGLVKTFGATRAVDGIDLTVPAGTFYGLVGPNGAGKTTTLSMISGLIRPDRGVVEIDGIDAARHPRDVKRMIGVLPDRLRTFDRLTGRQLLYYTGMLRGLAAGIVNARIDDLATAFDLTAALGRPVSDYSAGMTKKVMLAGALLHSPRLLVLDEPFEAVDPVSSEVILDILRAYVEHGGTVVLSSHGMELIERVCSRVAVIVAGQVLAEGTLDEVRGELTLEQRFLQLAGGLSEVEGLEWLRGFSS
ncbi:ATP-binding cassette domain-containing protein [Microbacterium protaetiae]|uniref:ATP-binding cassette domain-containing protein n=1 Tax=Microbacterium protaetiae TaxID=2509458 RepID=UPI001F5C9942|nr:ATP-binding cassette domain-containing protein [Microbacterium protaetiae]